MTDTSATNEALRHRLMSTSGYCHSPRLCLRPSNGCKIIWSIRCGKQYQKKWRFHKKDASSFFSMRRWCGQVWVMPVATGCCWRNGIISLLTWGWGADEKTTSWVQQKCNKAASLDILNSSEKTYSYFQCLFTDHSILRPRTMLFWFVGQGTIGRERERAKVERWFSY